MFDKIEILQLAHGLASHSAARQSVIARNIANADTPGYKAQDVASFADSYATRDSAALRATRDGHIGGEGASNLAMRSNTVPSESSPNGNSVSLESEMVKSTEARHHHDLALAVYKSALGVIRSSLGR